MEINMRYSELNEYIDIKTLDVNEFMEEIRQAARAKILKMTPEEIFYFLKKEFKE